MDPTSHQFLTGSRFAGDENRGPGRRHSFHQVEKSLHGCRPANHLGPRTLFPRSPPELGHFPPKVGLFPGTLEREEKLFSAEGFVDVVVRPQTHGFHRRVHRAERRHDDELGVGLCGRRSREDIQPVHPGKVQVQKDQIVELVVQGFESFLPRLHRIDLVSLLCQNLQQNVTDDFLVLHHQDPGIDVLAGHVFSHQLPFRGAR